jgi:hypothetical protein
MYLERMFDVQTLGNKIVLFAKRIVFGAAIAFRSKNYPAFYILKRGMENLTAAHFQLSVKPAINNSNYNENYETDYLE